VAFESGSSVGGDVIMNEAAAYVIDRLIGEEEEEAFHPIWMIVAQWDRVHPHPHGAPDSHEGISEEYLSKVSTIYTACAILHLSMARQTLVYFIDA
jgi:hypothetical protein